LKTLCDFCFEVEISKVVRALRKDTTITVLAPRIMKDHVLSVPDIGTVYAAFAILSVFLSGLVVLTGIMFPKSICHPSKPFSHIIFMISLCDFFGSIGCAMGLPPAGRPACVAQSFLQIYFMPASWIWTCCLVFQIRCVFFKRGLWVNTNNLQKFKLTVVTFTTFLPLTTNGFGQDDDLSQEIPCNFAGNPKAGFVWSIISVAMILVLSVVFMIVMVVQVVQFFRTHNLIAKPEYAKSFAIFRTTRLYPVGMLFCWIPFLAVGLFVQASRFRLTGFYEFALIMSTQYGTVTSIVFFRNCKIARVKWRELFCGSHESTRDGSTINAVSEGMANGAHVAESPVANKILSSSSGVHLDRTANSSHTRSVSRSVDNVVSTDYDDERLLYIDIGRAESTVENLTEMWRDSAWSIGRQSDDPSSHSAKVSNSQSVNMSSHSFHM
jgi:hypothetical protein